MENSTRGLLISVSGPSGVGKGTVINELRKRFPELKHSISVTTRSPRGEEQDGVEYYFRTKEEFEKLIEEGQILEYDNYVGNYYGTPVAPLEEKASNGFDVLLDITIAGSLALKAKFDEAVTVFLLPPSFEVLEERLKGRGTESDELVSKRMAKAREEVLDAVKFDYIVVNDNLEQAVEDITAIISAEKHKAARLEGIEKNL